jgi:PPM family protein phosphatase
MQASKILNAAGTSHSGLQRDNNEDRFYVDATRGIFCVIDGVGGHAAGEQAADTALGTLLARLERDAGPVEDRIREAITTANNEILRQASKTPSWKGMACVLTVAVVDNGHVVFGHVGDTRLYKFRHGHIEKLTRDHSPVGEREDAREISELDAMRHPRRNEVYRDVGSEPHQPYDKNFIDVDRVYFESDAALLLCSDGLTDCIPSSTINAIVEGHAGHPDQIVHALIEAANGAGGKDNVTAVYVEGARFVEGEDTRALRSRKVDREEPAFRVEPHEIAPRTESRWRSWALVCLLFVVIATAAYSMRDRWVLDLSQTFRASPRTHVVTPASTIAEALAAARPGDEIVVEPGEYRERLQLKSEVRLRSRVPRGASIRLAAGSLDTDAVVTAIDVTGAEFRGFRIVGDAIAPLWTGISLRNADITIADVEIAGAQVAAIEVEAGPGSVIASQIHDNPGAGLIVRASASPRIAHSTFKHNGTSKGAPGPIYVEPKSRPTFSSNMFDGIHPQALAVGTGIDVTTLQRDNFFAEPPPVPAPTPPPVQRPGRRGVGK